MLTESKWHCSDCHLRLLHIRIGPWYTVLISQWKTVSVKNRPVCALCWCKDVNCSSAVSVQCWQECKWSFWSKQWAGPCSLPGAAGEGALPHWVWQKGRGYSTYWRWHNLCRNHDAWFQIDTVMCAEAHKRPDLGLHQCQVWHSDDRFQRHDIACKLCWFCNSNLVLENAGYMSMLRFQSDTALPEQVCWNTKPTARSSVLHDNTQLLSTWQARLIWWLQVNR